MERQTAHLKVLDPRPLQPGPRARADPASGRGARSRVPRRPALHAVLFDRAFTHRPDPGCKPERRKPHPAPPQDASRWRPSASRMSGI
jgi:hypothetical protein